MHSGVRCFAIGDVHGCLEALEALLTIISPAATDRVVTLGDYVNRGPNSRGVLNRLIRLRNECELIPILGNHDEFMLEACRSGKHRASWLSMGGTATLRSYGAEGPEFGMVPQDHLGFLESCHSYFETNTHIFVHASYIETLSMEQQPGYVLRWESLRGAIPGPHRSGKRVIAGHTSQKSGEVLDLGYLKCIDTYCYGGKWLTALDVDNGELWQVSREGVPRTRLPRA
jgi:serine/threonine protein phosphatase 1